MNEPDGEVVEFLYETIKRCVDLIDTGKMQSFDISFEIKGKQYKMVLMENNIIDGKYFKPDPN